MSISKGKKNYLKEYFLENYNKAKKLWTKINELLSNKHKNVFINEIGCIITDQEIVAKKFNSYFVNFAHNLLKGLGETNYKFQDYVKNPNENSLFFKKIDPGEVKKLLENIIVNKATDVYGLSPKLVKLAKNFITEPLTKIF